MAEPVKGVGWDPYETYVFNDVVPSGTTVRERPYTLELKDDDTNLFVWPDTICSVVSDVASTYLNVDGYKEKTPIIIMLGQQWANISSYMVPNIHKPEPELPDDNPVEYNKIKDAQVAWKTGVLYPYIRTFPVQLLTQLAFGVSAVMTEHPSSSVYTRQLATTLGTLLQNADHVLDMARDDAAIMLNNVWHTNLRVCTLDVLALLYFCYGRVFAAKGEHDKARACVALCVLACHDVVSSMDLVERDMWIPFFTCGMLARVTTISDDGSWRVGQPFQNDDVHQQQYHAVLAHMWKGMLYDNGNGQSRTQYVTSKGITVYNQFRDDGTRKAMLDKAYKDKTLMHPRDASVQKSRLDFMLHISKCYIEGVCENARGWNEIPKK